MAPDYCERAGYPLGTGLRAGEAQLADAAAEAGISPRIYRRELQREYRTRLAAIRAANLAETDDSEEKSPVPANRLSRPQSNDQTGWN